jgi:alkanesulfonate monooxygenase SsuD/methylene tetrahydromethanopterin reductase-like flavin-dependent oxidoreductase (luciferase family)
VAALGDGWHPLGLQPPGRLEPDELARRIRRLRELTDAAGRDPSAITMTFKATVVFGDAHGPDRVSLTGAPSRIVEDLRAYVRAGVQHFVLNFGVPTVPEMLDVLERFAAEVRPHVGSAAG